MTIARRLQMIHERIHRACAQAGRDPASITLIAVSKMHPASAIQEAMAAGQRHFGENYAQHLRDKARELGVGPAVGDGGPPLPTWHFIGSLQRNKVKYVAGTASLVHGVDTEDLARAIGERSALHPTPVLVQVNIGDESTKSGVHVDQAIAFCKVVTEIPGVLLQGLMCVPPEFDDPEATRPAFRKLAEVAARGRDMGLNLPFLSMGMSSDFEVAIAEGATHVRVGTAIFGERT